jgi:S1-C subfamily serine protease
MEIAFVPDDQGRPQVGIVWQQGEPYQRGFRQGDVVQMIDNRPVTSLAQFARWGFERGREYTFTVSATDGTRKEVKWVRLK